MNYWAGTDYVGVARIAGGVAQTGWRTPYEGDLAIVRFFQSVLSAGNVETAFHTVGGAADEGNTIAFNSSTGVLVVHSEATGNAIRGNRIPPATEKVNAGSVRFWSPRTEAAP